MQKPSAGSQRHYFRAGCHSLRAAMPPKRGGGRGSGSAGRAGPGLIQEAPAAPALGQGEALPLVAPTHKYTDANPREVAVAVNEAHMLQVNEAMDIIREKLPGGAGKES
eukprot:3811203-Heterocapsa_arctica.AAC.1